MEQLYKTIDRACRKIAYSSKKISYRQDLSKIYEIIDKLEKEDQIILKDFIERTLEDDISLRIVDIITEDKRFKAAHDFYNNGHVDIHVQSEDYEHTWLGEAKLYSGNKYTQQGLCQLVHDYSKGLKNESGGILIYVDSTNLTTPRIITNWKDRLLDLAKDPAQKLIDLQVINDEDDNSVLYSEHKHHLSERQYKIRHFCLDLRSSPPKSTKS